MVTKQIEIIKKLAACDHGFLPKNKVREWTQAFGFEGTTYLAKANPQDFKGLSLYDKDGNPVDEMEGQDAHKVAMQICKHLGIEYQDMFGIGSQLRECVDQIRKYLEAKKAELYPV